MSKLWTCTFAVLVALLAATSSTTVAQTADELLSIERAGHAAVNAGDVEGMNTFWADDVAMDYVVAGSTPMQGKEMVAGFFSALFQGFPDFHVTQPLELASGNVAVTECVTTGTQQGVWLGIPGTGRSVRTAHMDIWEFEGTKVNKLTVYDDAVSMMVQLGLMPAPALPPLVPSFTLPAPVKTSLAPLDAVKAATGLWNSHDMTGWAKLLAQEGDYFYNTFGIPMDRPAFVAMQELYFQAFPDARENVIRTVDMGDGWTVTESVYAGTNTGPFFGIPETGRYVEVRAAYVIHRVDGLNVYTHVYMDNLTILSQLGLIPGPGSPSSVQPSTWGRIKSTFR